MPQKIKLLIFVLVLVFVCSCAHRSAVSNRQGPTQVDLAVENWNNANKERTELAGIHVQQLPDGPDESSYKGKHPAMILFVLWDGRVNQLGYTPSGEVHENFWWNLRTKTQDFSYLWDQLEYKYGTDPEFKNHKDPRRVKKTP